MSTRKLIIRREKEESGAPGSRSKSKAVKHVPAYVERFNAMVKAINPPAFEPTKPEFVTVDNHDFANDQFMSSNNNFLNVLKSKRSGKR